MTIIYYLQKYQKSSPIEDVLQPQSLVCVRCRAEVVNCWNCYSDYLDPLFFFLFDGHILLGVLLLMHSVKELISHSNTWHVAICDEAGESQWTLDFSAVKCVVKLLEAAIFEIVRSALVQVLLFSVAAQDRRIKASVWNCSSQSNGFWRFGLQCVNKILILL